MPEYAPESILNMVTDDRWEVRLHWYSKEKNERGHVTYPMIGWAVVVKEDKDGTWYTELEPVVLIDGYTDTARYAKEALSGVNRYEVVAKNA